MKKNKICKQGIDTLHLCEKCYCWKGIYKDLDINTWYNDKIKIDISCACESICCPSCKSDERHVPGTFIWPLSSATFEYISSEDWIFKCHVCNNDYDFLDQSFF